MDVLVTGAFGVVGTAAIEHLPCDEYRCSYLDRSAPPDDLKGRTTRADVSNYETIRPAFDGQDAVVHLAGCPHVNGSWEEVLASNVVGTRNVLAAAEDAGVERVVFASSSHVVGMYETENAPGIYDAGHGLTLDRHTPVRPNSYYGTSKSFGEDLGRYFVESRSSLDRFYALRFGGVRSDEYDHPYGDAERGVEEGLWERGSDEYGVQVARLKGLWLSRRDFARLLDRCLRDDSVAFDVFYGTSDNERRWFDIEYTRDVLGYDPADSGEDWDAPPA